MQVVALDGEVYEASSVMDVALAIDRPDVTKDIVVVTGAPSDAAQELATITQACSDGDVDAALNGVDVMGSLVARAATVAGITYLEGKPRDVWVDRQSRWLGRLAGRLAKYEYTIAGGARVRAFGPKVGSVLLAAALRERGLRAMSIDGCGLMMATTMHGVAKIDMDATTELIRQSDTSDMIAVRKTVPVISGGYVHNRSNEKVDLGPRGADYTAVAFAAARNILGVTLVRQLPGLPIANDEPTDRPSLYHKRTYGEAKPFSASMRQRSLHPAALALAASQGIVISVRGIENPHQYGTTISGAEPTKAHG